MWMLFKAAVSAGIIVAVSEISPKYPRWGAVLLSLPVVSLLAFMWIWLDQRNLPVITKLARETLVLVPLGLPFFIPLALCDRLQLGFWSAFALGTVLAILTISAWLRFAAS